MSQITLSLPHTLSATEARQRVEQLIDELHRRYAEGDHVTKSWKGSTLTFRIDRGRQSVSGRAVVEAALDCYLDRFAVVDDALEGSNPDRHRAREPAFACWLNGRSHPLEPERKKNMGRLIATALGIAVGAGTTLALHLRRKWAERKTSSAGMGFVAGTRGNAAVASAGKTCSAGSAGRRHRRQPRLPGLIAGTCSAA